MPMTVTDVDAFCRKQTPEWGYEFFPWNVWKPQHDEDGDGFHMERDETMPVYSISVDEEGGQCEPEFYEGVTWEEVVAAACEATGVPFKL